ncbi:azurin [Pseudomonas sp. zbq_4]|uniref:azurin n=1 Tax=Pseudomonas TaxID=286 RepID=UPI00370C759F
MNKLSVLAFALLSPVVAHASNCNIEVTSSDQMRFDKNLITIDKSCSAVNLTLNNAGTLPKTAMGHNIVIVKKADVDTVAQASMAAGPASEYVKADHPKILAHTKMLGGGEKDTVSVDPSKFQVGEEYVFFCSFPGHRALMSGNVVVAR